jgi:hypothetical protein
MGNDKVYVYGSSNGAEYDEVTDYADGQGNAGREIKKRTHWDPRIEVLGWGPDHGLVQIGVVPPTPVSARAVDPEGSTPVQDVADIEATDGVWEWFSDNGQFMQLDRSGLNRLIEALQEAGAATFGRDRW